LDESVSLIEIDYPKLKEGFLQIKVNGSEVVYKKINETERTEWLNKVRPLKETKKKEYGRYLSRFEKLYEKKTDEDDDLMDIGESDFDDGDT